MHNQQTDIFAAGQVHSLPPHLDPAIVGAIHTRAAVDRDHVGAQDVGRYGNNADVVVVEVWNQAGEIIFAEQCSTAKAAVALCNHIGQKLDANRQQQLFA